MIGAWITGSLLTNKWTYIGLIVAIAVGGAFYRGMLYERGKVETETVEVLECYIKDKDKISHKYRGNRFSDEMILSGCVPEAAKGQAHCKEVK